MNFLRLIKKLIKHLTVEPSVHIVDEMTSKKKYYGNTD